MNLNSRHDEDLARRIDKRAVVRISSHARLQTVELLLASRCPLSRKARFRASSRRFEPHARPAQVFAAEK
jgi:hypothetical protein